MIKLETWVERKNTDWNKRIKTKDLADASMPGNEYWVGFKEKFPRRRIYGSWRRQEKRDSNCKA